MTYDLRVDFAQSPEDVIAAQRLRYRVFVQELGADGPLVDHDLQLERDHYDRHAAHLLLRDLNRASDDQVVGVYRLMTDAMAQRAGRFYCAAEYDLSVLQGGGRNLLELGRSCLHPDYRGGAGMMHLWAGLSTFVAAQEIDVIFGVASFQGTDIQALAQPLSFLHHRHLAPAELRVKVHGATAARMDMISPENLDRLVAVRQLPALIKGYLRLGATVGEGAFVDHAFNTTDICLILQRDAINALRKTIYAQGTHGG